MGDRIAPVAAEVAHPQLDAWRCLPALVFGEVEQPLDPLDGLALEPLGDELVDTLLVLDQPKQNAVEQLMEFKSSDL